jgi:hypothetical protein
MPKKNKVEKRQRRKFWISAISIALYALIGWLRFQQTLLYWYYLIELDLWPHPIYLAISGGLIGTGYSLAFIFHVIRYKFTHQYIRVLGLILIVWIWIDRIWIGMRDSFVPLLPITILITICTIGLDVFFIRKIKYGKKKIEHAK